ncbi:PPC domain-containing protein [Zavarzinella formosa]|uniref:PPC domain-containing protein n=1 Tax=Zavarzinella formosa TaxID=360055 RepID=UPI0002E5501A|nr:PPC domain-containing protein [Zavarzinella formosa]
MRYLFPLLLLTAPAFAELPSPRFDRLTPNGGGAGSTVEVQIQGQDLEETKQLLFDQPGLKAEFVKDKAFKITVAADVPAGIYDVWAGGKYGVSNPKLFVVSKGFTEVAEKEPNDDPTTAQVVAVNSIINGQSDGNKEDVYRFPLKKGDRVIIDCQSGKLESLMDATLTLSSGDGKQLASNGDYNGRDPFIDHTAAADGDYLVSVYDLSFRGGFNYRLAISTKPQIENVFPRAVQAGKPTAIMMYGRNLGPAGKPSSWSIDEQKLDERADTITPPADLMATGRYVFHEHPTDHSVLPTAATSTLTGFQYRATIDGFATNGVPMLVTDGPVTLEAEPNDDPKNPQKIKLPATVSGRFDKPRDADWYEFETTEDGPYVFNVYCERIAGRADPYLVVMDDKDNRVQELDDFGPRVMAFDGHLRDPSGTVNLSKNRKYRVLVQDRYSRGGARYQYVLTVSKPEPNFYAAVIHGQNLGPGALNLRKGGTAHLDAIIQHADGTSAPVTITAEGLPPGIHTAPLYIHTDTRGTMVFWADADAPDFTGPIKLVAISTRLGKEVKREVRAYCRSDSTQNIASSRPMRSLMVSVRETSPFLLIPEKEKIEAEAGSKVTLKLQLDRKWPDFKNAVTLIPQNFPGPIKMGNVVIAEGKNEGTVTLEIQNGTRPGQYTVVIAGQGQVPFVKEGGDPKAKNKGGNTLVSSPAKPITLTVLESAKKK